MMIELLITAADKGGDSLFPDARLLVFFLIIVSLSVFTINVFLNGKCQMDKPSFVLSVNSNDPSKIIRVSRYSSSQMMKIFTSAIIGCIISIEVGLGSILFDTTPAYRYKIHVFCCILAIIAISGSVANIAMYHHTKDEEMILNLNHNRINNRRNIWRRTGDFIRDLFS
jgi:hypothetical protein